MSITDCKFQIPPGNGWQELPRIDIRAIGPLMGSSVSVLLSMGRGPQADVVSVPFQLRAKGKTYNLDLNVTVDAFTHLKGGAKLEDLLGMLVAGEGHLSLRLEKVHAKPESK